MTEYPNPDGPTRLDQSFLKTEAKLASETSSFKVCYFQTMEKVQEEEAVAAS